MKTYHLDADEWYPVYRLSALDIFGKTAEFSDEEVADIKRVSDEFIRIQAMISERFGNKYPHGASELIETT